MWNFIFYHNFFYFKGAKSCMGDISVDPWVTFSEWYLALSCSCCFCFAICRSFRASLSIWFALSALTLPCSLPPQYSLHLLTVSLTSFHSKDCVNRFLLHNLFLSHFLIAWHYPVLVTPYSAVYNWTCPHTCRVPLLAVLSLLRRTCACILDTDVVSSPKTDAATTITSIHKTLPPHLFRFYFHENIMFMKFCGVTF